MLITLGDTQVEEARLDDAASQMPDLITLFNDYMESLARTLAHATHFDGALRACYDHGLALWRAATQRVQRHALKDDRPLYWARLQMLQRVRQQRFAFAVTDEQRKQLLQALEDASRGRTSAHFTQTHSKRILVSGFDPFGFTKTEGEITLVDLSVSNPSGAAALELSNTTVFHNGVLAEVQAAIFPVRFEDFDLGAVEAFFRPYFEQQRVDMIITISRGRKEFDLERFTGRRRSSRASDNAKRSIWDETPVSILPLYAGAHLEGAEFLESTLPINHCLRVQSPYKTNDNRRVTFLNGQSEPESVDAGTCAELADKISVSASGGGFLSNEISYRTHLLRDRLGSTLPVGHLHIPTPDTSPLDTSLHETTHNDPQTNQATIVAQTKAIIKAALLSL